MGALPEGGERDELIPFVRAGGPDAVEKEIVDPPDPAVQHGFPLSLFHSTSRLVSPPNQTISHVQGQMAANTNIPVLRRIYCTALHWLRQKAFNSSWMPTSHVTTTISIYPVIDTQFFIVFSLFHQLIARNLSET